MKNILCILLLCAVSTFAQTFSIEGHRGARGYLPENTIPSFIKALEQGADTIELDVVISQDNKIVVSHEPWFSHIISTKPDGTTISADKEKDFNIYKMKYSEVKKFDVGIIGNKDFPQQVKMKVYKPLLGDVFKAIKDYAKKNKLKPIRVNVEIKSNPTWDNVFTPTPEVFAKMIYQEILKHKMQNDVIVQSFDVRQLQELRKMPIKLPLALLVGNKDGIEKNLEKLGFNPDTYSPHFGLVDEATVIYCQKNNLKIVPWTVNEIADLEKMKKFKLDGIITDFPDRAVKVFGK
ncbi:MAG: glycerophosphodiester phosphodiesterase family protein [Acidobacteriota bacterium]